MRLAPTSLACAALAIHSLAPSRALATDNPSALATEKTSATLSESKRLARVAAEVQRRRQIREDALADARRLVAEHESGQKPATAAALVTARELIRDAESAQARAKQSKSGQLAQPGSSHDPNSRVTLRLPEADMVAVATVWRMYFGENVLVSERVKHKTVTATLDEKFGVMRHKLEAVLLKHGIVIVSRPEGKYFDAAP